MKQNKNILAVMAVAATLIVQVTSGYAQTIGLAKSSFHKTIHRLNSQVRYDHHDFKSRVSAISWSGKQKKTDTSHHRNLTVMQPAVRNWQAKFEQPVGKAKMNASPYLTTYVEIPNIYFTHVRPKHPNALPLIITHVWHESVLEQIKLIVPLDWHEL